MPHKTITKEEVLRIAALAKIAITPEEAAKFTPELESILTYFEQLQAVDTTGLEPTYQVTGLMSIMRKDAPVNYGTTQATLLANAPHQREGSIEVPKVL